MERITDIFQRTSKTFSFELFPPKTDKGFENLKTTIAELVKLKPDFISCTYGAGGGSRDKTFDIVELIEKKHQTVAMAHLTCVLNTKEDIKKIVEDIKTRNVRNILALRGDAPVDHPNWQPGDDNFKYSSELAGFIRQEFSDYFGIGVAGFPEGHLLCPDRERDADFLRTKINAGADFVITQIFFDNQDYFDYIQRLKDRNVTARVLPGIIPITDYNALERFSAMCGASIPEQVQAIFKPLSDDKEATLEAGIAFCIRQCRELLDNGAPGIHFYSLNKVEPTATILKALQ